ncbi:hypothetical protein F444_22573 [Phytophthora nicotianae P1976]|uniref:Uncharacterized protein n=1 Tax=Phytophthora nicotianae P1976 TaxID=1317066 RepID=A0A080YXD9_PHYNI|nr:hypothetical protein F444_22573 [Phytophthora nicotianae P1976]
MTVFVCSIGGCGANDGDVEREAVVEVWAASDEGVSILVVGTVFGKFFSKRGLPWSAILREELRLRATQPQRPRPSPALKAVSSACQWGQASRQVALEERSKNWTTEETLELVQVWRQEFEKPHDSGESTAFLNTAIYNTFKALCGGVTERSEKVVTDKKNTLPIAYKFMVGINNNRFTKLVLALEIFASSGPSNRWK